MATPEPDDATLVRAARSADPLAVERLAARWWARIRRWALVELGDPALADDGAQEALVRLLRHIGTCDPERPFGSWLRRLVRNACTDLRTRRGPVAAPVDEAGPLRMDRARDLRIGAERARAAFLALTPRQRQVIELCDREGLTPAEAADELGIAHGTARALLHQGRTELRKRLVAHRAELVALLREAE